MTEENAEPCTRTFSLITSGDVDTSQLAADFICDLSNMLYGLRHEANVRRSYGPPFEVGGDTVKVLAVLDFNSPGAKGVCRLAVMTVVCEATVCDDEGALADPGGLRFITLFGLQVIQQLQSTAMELTEKISTQLKEGGVEHAEAWTFTLTTKMKVGDNGTPVKLAAKFDGVQVASTTGVSAPAPAPAPAPSDSGVERG